jgi:ribosome biogenesis GTPase
MERYLILSWNSGASPVIVLNKADLCTDIPACINDIERAMQEVPIHVVSAKERLGLDILKEHFVKGTTAVFLGPSGVGKSSIINALLGEKRLKVGEVRSQDRRGRHTTSHRELFLLPGGGVVIDTPGIREIQLWAGEDALSGAFTDIEQLALECRFGDCTHTTEPGCAISKAIEQGILDAKRFQSYMKLGKEIRYLEMHQRDKTRLEEKARWKKISKWQKELKKLHPKQ